MPGRYCSPIDGIGPVRQREHEEHGHDDPEEQPEQQRAGPIRAGRHTDRREGAGDGDRDEQQHAMEHAPADRAEQPLPEEQRRADDGEDAREQQDRDGDPDEGRDPLDLATDGLGLGLGQVDVGDDQPHAGVAGRADLGERDPAVWVRGGSRVVQGECSGSDGRAAGADLVAPDDSSADMTDCRRAAPRTPRRTVTLTNVPTPLPTAVAGSSPPSC